MNGQPFRFGVSMLGVGSRSSWRDQVRHVEELGYNMLHLADHPGLPAPFPALAAAADVSASLRLGTYVLNGGLLNPTYLARDTADLYRLTDGRFELGLGTGYIQAEFEAAGVPFGTPGQRVRKLEDLVTGTRDLLAKEPDRPLPRIMLAGAGDRMLRLGGRLADIFSFPITAGITPGLAPEEALRRRIELLREAAGGRPVELNLFIAAVGDSVDALDLGLVSQVTGIAEAELVHLPGVLVGSPAQIAEKVLRYREEFGIAYLSILEPHMTAFAAVIKHLN
jgi:probable F420-dependent oxidoreductase